MIEPGQGFAEPQSLVDEAKASRAALDAKALNPGQREFVMPKLDGPFTVSLSAGAHLRACAEAKCSRCDGTGVSGWKRRGHRAIVCRCTAAKWNHLTGQTKVIPAAPSQLFGVDGNPIVRDKASS